MWYATGEKWIEASCGNQKEREKLEDLGVDGKAIKEIR
jgi:hypothetical protein